MSFNDPGITPIGSTRTEVRTGSTAGYRTSERRPRQMLRSVEETKSAFLTTEFWVYVLAVAGVLIASALVGSDSNASTTPGSNPTGDYFRASQAWLLITLLTIGYTLSRGLAKAGSHNYHRDEDIDLRD